MTNDHFQRQADQRAIIMKTKCNLLNAVLLTTVINWIKGCQIDFGSETILNCWKDGKNIHFKNEEKLSLAVSHGTQCLQKSENGLTVLECQYSKWTTYPGNESALVLKSNVRHKRGLFSVVFCVLTFFSCLWGGRSNPDPDPPYINCKKHVYATAIPIQTYAVVHWEEPIATDRHNKKYTPRRYGKGPGQSFSEGLTQVDYVAKNNRGEKGTCTINIHVEVKRCKPVPSPLEHGYVLCHPSTYFVYGSVCKFGCYDGFELSRSDSTSMTCRNNSRWSIQQPTCKRFQCLPLEEIEGSTISCSNGRFYQSICTYTCKPGFDMPPGVSKTVVCTRYKTWRKYGIPKCIDVESPKFEFCPSIVVHGTDPGINTSSVVWKEPSVIDNSGLQINPIQQHGPVRESKVTAGIYRIVYEAQDSVGNKAKSCQFNVIVKDVICHRLFPTPNMRVSCPHGYRTGSGCDISCNPGTVLDGLEYVQCDESSKGSFGEWNWKKGKQPLCKRTNKCVPLDPPKNGAVVCDNWTGGLYCQFQCRKGTDMANVDWRRLHTCSRVGDWFPDPVIKACNEMRRPLQMLAVNIAFYYNGDCTDTDTKEEIAKNFINSVKTSMFKETSRSPQCIPSNVKITCGESEIKRRSVQNVKGTKLFISANLAPISTTINGTFYEMRDTFVSLYTNFKTYILQNASSIFKENVTVLTIENHGIEVKCPVGAVKSGQTLNCVDCPQGTYYRTGTGTCEFCTKGTYQQETGQLHCNYCPQGTTTRDKGAFSLDDCQKGCSAGTFSWNGLYPCSPCEHGFYQGSTGQTVCRACNGCMTTLNIGASSISECQEFDIGILHGFKTEVTSLLETVNVTDFSLSFWVRKQFAPENSYFSVAFNDDHDRTVWSYNFLQMNIYNKIYKNMTVDIHDTKWHLLTIVLRGCTAQIFLDKMPVTEKQVIHPCLQYTFNKIVITADETFGGEISQLNVWRNMELYKLPFKCFSHTRGDLFAWKQFGQSILDGSFIQVPSSCDDFNNCISSPCMYGTCVDEIGTFSCICEAGYTGTQCDINKDDCHGNICMNGATCMDGLDTYSCLCPENLTGLFCEIHIVNGGWSDWGPWTECSLSCGEGSQTRERVCNNPFPDSGGENCTGTNEDVKACNENSCPSCAEIKAPSNGTLDCINDNETISCNISCNDGYEFDISPLDSYTCGPETFHEWNFESTENPKRKLPTCVGIEMPENIEVFYTARYRDLVCSNVKITEEARVKIEVTAKRTVSDIPCLRSGLCKLDQLRVVDCNEQDRRRRSSSTAGFTLTLSTRPNDGQGEKNLEDLQKSFQKIQEAADNDEFTIEIMHGTFHLDNGLTSLSGNLQCGPGMTRVKHYCVPCGAGAFLSGDVCQPCDTGKYQDKIGQTSCLNCPKGLTTVGIASASVDECSVKKISDIEEGIQVVTLVLAIIIPVAVIILLIYLYRRLKTTLKKSVDPAMMQEYPMQHTTSDPLGLPNRRFKFK